MTKAIYFDLDGTIVDLYSVPGWLEALQSFQPSPYIEAKPIWDMSKLTEILAKLKANGYTIGIITWLSKNSTKNYDQLVRKAKKTWLQMHNFWSCIDEIHMVKYGTPKHTIAKVKYGVLVDDNEEVRKKWENYGGLTINPMNCNLIKILEEINYE